MDNVFFANKSRILSCCHKFKPTESKRTEIMRQDRHIQRLMMMFEENANLALDDINFH